MPVYSGDNQNNKTLLSWKNLKLSHEIKQSLHEQTYSFGEVTTIKGQNIQKLNLTVAGLHPKKCFVALSKISQYENYSNFISFIESSQYNDKSRVINLKIDHILMPFPMYLLFKIDRVDKIGNYTFTFEQGFLKGLEGIIQTAEHRSRCLFYFNAKWKGKKSKIPDTVFSFFLDVLGQRLLDNLFRVSRTL
jgi:hypothetical protein